jgi:hemerythrin-like domain-containing protein
MEAPSHGTTLETPIGPNDRLTVFGNQLIEVHIWLREELARLRADVDSYLDGRGERPRELRAHCLTFCSAVSRHHNGEDAGAFPLLADHFPELRPVLTELERDHRLVAGMLRDLEELLGGLGADPDPAGAQRVRAELDGLSALLESHFGYEEKRLVSALDSLRGPDWDGSWPDFLAIRRGGGPRRPHDRGDGGESGRDQRSRQRAGTSSVSSSRTRASISSRIGRTFSTGLPAGSSSRQSR